MTFQVGDRVRYVNYTSEGVKTAQGKEGVVTYINKEAVRVMFDSPCWFGQHTHQGTVLGLWKWELVTPRDKSIDVINKIHSLQTRFKNKTLKTKKVTPIPFPKGV